MVGHFWPTDVYRAFEGCEPPKADLTTYEHNGKAQKGIYRSPRFGLEAGVIIVYNIGESGGVKTAKLDNSRTALSKDQVKDTWKGVQQRSQLKTTTPKKDNSDDADFNAPLKVTAPIAKKRSAEHSCALDDLWETMAPAALEPPDSTGGLSSENKAMAKKKIRRDGAGGGGSGGGPPGGPRESPTPNPKGNGGGGSKGEALSLRQLKEVDATETCVLSARQLMNRFSDSAGCLSITEKQIGDIIHKLEGRLVPRLVEIYSVHFDPFKPETSESKPMKLWSELQSMRVKFEQFKGFVGHLQNEKSSGLDVCTAFDIAKTAGLEVAPAFVMETAFVRDTICASDAKSWAVWTKMINPKTTVRQVTMPSDKGPDRELMTLAVSPEGLHATLQAKAILRALTVVMRPEKNFDALVIIADNIHAIESCVLEPRLKAEMVILYKFCHPWKHTDTLKRDKAIVLTDTNALLYRHYKSFGTGIDLINRVDGVINQMLKDSGHSRELLSLVEEIGTSDLANC